MIVNRGTPVVGTVTLGQFTNGPAQFNLFTVMGSTAYRLGLNERVVIDTITVSSNDPANAKVTIDTGGNIPTTVASVYVASGLPVYSETISPGIGVGLFGFVQRATASAVAVGQAIQVTIVGYVETTSLLGVLNPLTIPGLLFWGNPGSIQQTSNAVTQWSDLSAGARHFVQATGLNQPVYNANLLNGSPGMTFDGVNSFVENAAWSAFPKTVVFVCQDTGTTSAVGSLFGLAGGAGIYSNAGSQYIVDGTGANASTSAATPAGTIATWQVVAAVYPSNNSTLGTTVYQNNAVTGTFAATGSVAVNLAATPAGIGWRDDGIPARKFKGNITECIVSSVALGPTWINAISKYLGANYAIAQAA